MTFLHRILQEAGLIKSDKNRLVLTKKGESFLERPNVAKLLSKILYSWIYKIDWEYLHTRNSSIDLLGSVNGDLQHQAELWLSYMLEKQHADYINTDDISPMNKQDKDWKFRQNLIRPVLSREWFFYWQWLGVFEHMDLESLRPWLSDKAINYHLTKFGRELLSQLAIACNNERKRLIPESIRELN